MAHVIKMQNLNPQQLYHIKQGLQSQISQFGQSMTQLRYALDRYEQGKRSIKAIQDTPDGQQILMPLSGSLYVEGFLNNKINNEKKYLIEYGVGYFVERNAKESIEYYNRKIILIKQKLTKVQQIITQKRDGLRTIQARIVELYSKQNQIKKN